MYKEIWVKNKKVNFLILLFLLAWPIEMVTAKTTLINLNIDIKHSHAINRGIAGVDGEIAWTKISYVDQQTASRFINSGFREIRFPGGTTANYFLWKTKGYGCEYNDIKLEKKSISRLMRYQNLSRIRSTKNGTDQFIIFLKKTKAKFSLVINIVCDTPENAAEWVHYFKEHNIKVNKVELGNEIYYKEYRWRFPSPFDYRVMASKYISAISQAAPDIKFGLIVSSAPFRSPEYPNVKRMMRSKELRYQLALDTDIGQKKTGDAVIIHLYVDPFDVVYQNIWNDNNTNREIYKTSVNKFDRAFPQFYTYIRKLLNGREIWVTEWGILFYGNNYSRKKSFVDSIYNAIYVANVILSFALTEHITYAYYHNLPDIISSGTPSLTLTARVFRRINSLVSRCHEVFPISIIRTNESIKIEKKTISGFKGVGFVCNDKVYIALINKGFGEYSIKNFKVGSSYVKASIVSRLTANDEILYHDGAYDESNIILPALSLTVVSIKQ